MADHPRKLIRAAAVAALIGTAPNYATAAGARVFPTRMIPYKANELPAIAVYTLTETVDPKSRASAPQELARTAELAIEGALEAKQTVDDDLDSLAFDIENAIEADDTLSGTVSWVWLKTTELSVLERGDQRIGVVRLVFEAAYYTAAPPEGITIPDDLKTVDVRYSLGGTPRIPTTRRKTNSTTWTSEDRMFLKPARPDLIVRDPISLQPLPAEGREIQESSFWVRRLIDGDVVEATAPSEEQPVAKPTARSNRSAPGAD
jgi:hypothetical protein